MSGRKAEAPLPCPFCGGMAVCERASSGAYWIGCRGECPGREAAWGRDMGAAVADWNRRTPTPSPPAAAALRLVKAMREARTAPDGGIVVAGLIGNESTALMAALTALPAPKPPSLRERLEQMHGIAAFRMPGEAERHVRAWLAAHAAAHPEDADAVGRMCGDD